MNPLNLSIRLMRLIRKQCRSAHIPAKALAMPAHPEPAAGVQASSPGSTHHIPAGNPASTPALLPYRMKALALPAPVESGDINQSKPLTIMVCSELSPLPLGIIKMLDLYKRTNH